METLALRGQIKKVNNSFIIYPATKADWSNLTLYTNLITDKYSTITFKSGSGSKSYSQVKTAWALITMLCVAKLGRKPTKKEINIMYAETLDMFADKELQQGILSSEPKYVPVSISKMSKRQLARYIQSMMQMLHENTHGFLLSPDDMIEISELFSEWNNFLSCLDVDPTDLDDNGEYLSLEEYRRTHTVSYASGRVTDNYGGPLEMAHIVSRGSDPAFENCCWNVMMLTHEEHQEIMHQEGWNALIARYPHIRGRVDRAFNMAHHIYKVAEQNGVEL